MKELTKKHINFLSNKVIPLLEELGTDTITFDEIKYNAGEMTKWVNQILDRGEYTTNEKRLLTGLSKLYELKNKK